MSSEQFRVAEDPGPEHSNSTAHRGQQERQELEVSQEPPCAMESDTVELQCKQEGQVAILKPG